MNTVFIHMKKKVSPEPFAFISCVNYNFHEQYQVYKDGKVYKWKHYVDEGYDWHEVDSNEPNYEEIKKIGLELLG